MPQMPAALDVLSIGYPIWFYKNDSFCYNCMGSLLIVRGCLEAEFGWSNY